MAKGYWIAFYRSIKDPDALAAYAKASGPAFAAAGAKILARGVPAQTYEAGLKERTVVIEFPSYEEAIACYNSPEYQSAKTKRQGAGTAEIVIVEGV